MLSAHQIFKPQSVITIINFIAPFDQNDADALGVKERFFDENGTSLTGLKKGSLELELFGANVVMIPKQKDLFNNTGLAMRSLRVSGFVVLKRSRDGKHDIKFCAAYQGIPDELKVFMETVKSQDMDIAIAPANKELESQAMATSSQLGLFRPEKDDDGDDDDEPADDPDDPEVSVEQDSEEDPAPAEETVAKRGRKKKEGVLASKREMAHVN